MITMIINFHIKSINLFFFLKILVYFHVIKQLIIITFPMIIFTLLRAFRQA